MLLLQVRVGSQARLERSERRQKKAILRHHNEGLIQDRLLPSLTSLHADSGIPHQSEGMQSRHLGEQIAGHFDALENE